jgi:hypothetical protein
MRNSAECLLAMWAMLIVTASMLPLPVASQNGDNGTVQDISVIITTAPDNPKAGIHVGMDISLSNMGNATISFNYSIAIENFTVSTGAGCVLQPREWKNHFVAFGWVFDEPGTYRIRVILSDANGTGELLMDKDITVTPNPSFFKWSSGMLKSLRVVTELVPCKAGVGFFLYTKFANTGLSSLVVDYHEYGGFGNIIGNGSQVEIPPMPNNWILIEGSYWAADPTGNGMYPLGINVTDVNGKGRLVEYQIITHAASVKA